ncbi:MAG: hypothetical protein LBV03_04760 [Fusobacteriales bacterium]|jgi:transposase|nr:hypothetical protein [Fusobacteriales bacterium]
MFKSNYEPEFKEMVICLHLEEGRIIGSITKEYHLGKGTVLFLDIRPIKIW